MHKQKFLLHICSTLPNLKGSFITYYVHTQQIKGATQFEVIWMDFVIVFLRTNFCTFALFLSNWSQGDS